MSYVFTLPATIVVILVATTSDAFAQRIGNNGRGSTGFKCHSDYFSFGHNGFGLQVYLSGNDLLVSNVLRTNESHVWCLSEHQKANTNNSLDLQTTL